MYPRKTAIWSALSLLMAFALVLSACQQAGTTQQQAADQADPNGQLTTNTGSEPDTIDPQKESFVNEVAQTMMVFESLMTFDADTLKPIPGAAKEAPQVTNNGQTYTYTLRDGLKYSDGSEVKAGDFAFGFTRLCDPTVAGEYAFTGYVIKGCEDWNTSDPKADKAKSDSMKKVLTDTGIQFDNAKKTITFNLTEPAPYFNDIAALWVGVPSRESDVTKGGDKWTEPATFIGNGPFVMSEWKHNEKIVFTPNPNYRTQPKIKKWTRVMINENSVAFAAYRNNELDTYAVAAEDLRTIEADSDLKGQVADGPDSCTFYYGYNVKKAPFDDKAVRQAFAKSFDRDAFIKDIQKIGKSSLAFIPPGMPGYDEGDTFQKYDVAAAKSLLAGSKYANTDTLKTIKFTYRTSATNKTRVEWVQQQWKTNLGIDVALDPVDATTFSQLVKAAATTPQLFLLGWCADYPDQQDWLTTVFHSSSTVTRTGYSNPQYDSLVKAADKEGDAKKRDDGYQQASRLLSQDAPVAFLYYSAKKTLIKPWVKGVKQTAMDFALGIFKVTDIFVAKH